VEVWFTFEEEHRVIDQQKAGRSAAAVLAAHPVIGGAALGLTWGAVMRGWMRLISTVPEFSWGGTFFILGATTIAGTVLGLARLRRLRGGEGWWRLSLLALMGLGAGGAVMWPTVIAWGLAFGRRQPLILVAPLGLAGAAIQVPIVRESILDGWRRGSATAVVAVVLYIIMLAIEAWAFSVVFARGAPGVAMKPWKRTVVAIPMMAMAGFAAIVTGLAG
jgi:hypothetical protein